MQFHFGKGPKQPQYVWPHFWKTNHVPSKIDCLDLCLWRWRLRNELNFLELDVLDSTWFWVVRMILCIQKLYLFREKKKCFCLIVCEFFLKCNIGNKPEETGCRISHVVWRRREGEFVWLVEFGRSDVGTLSLCALLSLGLVEAVMRGTIKIIDLG